MERLILELRQSKPLNMNLLIYMTQFLIGFNLTLAFLMSESVSLISVVVHLLFTIARNLPFIAVRGWELWLFIKSKRTRLVVLGKWRLAAKKLLKVSKPSKNDGQ